MEVPIDIFQFGSDFKTWVKILNTNISSCIINNGFASEPFTLKRGVRQGCPLSGLLFILAAELLSCSVRANDHIKGIRVSNKRHHLLLQGYRVAWETVRVIGPI